MSEDEQRTVWIGNLSNRVTEELLYELFLQIAPLESVKIATDKNGRKLNYAFVTVQHDLSVEYAVKAFDGLQLFEKRIIVKQRNTGENRIHQPPYEPPPVFHFNPIMILSQMDNHNERSHRNRFKDRNPRYRNDRNDRHDRNDYNNHRNDNRTNYRERNRRYKPY